MARLLRTLGALSLLLCLSCCSKKKKQELEPLTHPSWLLELPVPGFGPASVALPLGASTPRPLAVVLHGGADRPEWQCGSFRGVLGGHVFILCPRGVARQKPDERFGLGNPAQTAAELRAALKALKERFGKHVAGGSIVLIGYAEGGEQAVDLARQEPSFFARLALVQSEPDALTPGAAKIFSDKGGKQVLFFCTDQACEGEAALRALLLKRQGVKTKTVRKDVGPYLDRRFADALRGEMAWLVSDDPRWQKPRP